jgi:hypothetical protein
MIKYTFVFPFEFRNAGVEWIQDGMYAVCGVRVRPIWRCIGEEEVKDRKVGGLGEDLGRMFEIRSTIAGVLLHGSPRLNDIVECIYAHSLLVPS